MKFRKKPIVVDAERVLADAPLPKGVSPQYDLHEDSFHLGIETRQGIVRVDIGDWIITAPDGERYPCKPDVFAATYEPIKP